MESQAFLAEISEASQPMPTDIKSDRPLLKVFLEGLYDDECHLSKLRGLYFILKAIWTDVVQYHCKGIRKCGCGIAKVQECQCVPYPKLPAPMGMGGLNVNMLPFICGREFKDYKLPETFKQYEGLIKFCLHHQLKMNPNFLGKVCYITVWEKDAAVGNFLGHDCMHTQSGLNVNFPGGLDSKWQCRPYLKHRGVEWINNGGVYLMSNVPDSIRFWKCKVSDKFVKPNGNIEHMREFLPNAAKNCWNGLMESGRVYRITERTPLDCLPLKKQTKVQFFRITTSKVPFWCKDHYTENPLGVLPDPRSTEIVSNGQILKDWKEEALKLMTSEDTGTSAPCSCVFADQEKIPINTEVILHVHV